MAHPFLSLLRNQTLPATLLRSASRPTSRSILRSLPQRQPQPLRRSYTTPSPSSSNPFRNSSSRQQRLSSRFFSSSRAFRDSKPPKPSASTTSSASSSASSAQSLTLTQRLKKITREYGWAAVGVYLALSAADFPFCYLLVRALGVDRIGEIEHRVVGWCKSVWRKGESAVSRRRREEVEEQKGEGESEIQAASHAVRGEASVWTQLVLAYAIHKSVFIFVRVPLTAAITPKVVKTLRSWGWNIGKRR